MWPLWKQDCAFYNAFIGGQATCNCVGMSWSLLYKIFLGFWRSDSCVCLDHVELVTLEQKLEELREPALAL